MNSNKQNIFNKFIELFIIIKDKYHYSTFVGFYIHFMSTLFPISIIILQELESNNSYLLTTLLILIRPDILILKTLGMWEQYGFIVVSSIFLLHKVCLLFLIYNYKKMVEPEITKFNQLILQFVSFYQTFYYSHIHLLQSMICMQNIKYSQYYGNIHVIIISFILFIFLQIEALISLYYVESLITYRLRLLDKIEISIYDILLYFLKLLQLLIFGLLQLQSGNIEIQSIFTLIISIIEVINQISYRQYIYDSIQTLTYCSYIFSFFYSIFFIIEQEQKQLNLRSTLSLILCPLAIQLCIKYDQYNQIQQFMDQFKYKQNQQINNLIYTLVKVLNTCENQSPINQIRQSLILFKHRETCNSLKCVCLQEYLNISHYNGQDDTIENQYIQHNLNQIQQVLTKNNAEIRMKFKYAVLLYSYNNLVQAVKYFQMIIGPKQLKRGNIQNKNLMTSFATMDLNRQIPNLLKIKIQYLISESKKRINLELKEIKNKQFEISDQIQKFFLHEQEMSEILTSLKQVVVVKLKFYHLIKCRKDLELDNLINQVVRATYIFKQLTDNIKIKYEAFPSKKLQTIMCFIESNINNNLAEANKIVNFNALSEQTLLQYSSNNSFNLYSDEISYLICSVEEDYQNLQIERASQTFLKTYETLDFKQVLPLFVVHTHPLVVSRFLKYGQSKFYRQFKQNYIKGKDGFTKVMKLCFDNMQTIFNNQMTLLAFIQQSEEYSAYLMIDVNKQVRSMTKMLLKQFGYVDEFILNHNITENWFEFIDITKLIPNFEELSSGQDQSITKANNVLFNFYNLNQLVNSHNRIQNIEINSIREYTQLQMIEYQVDLVIARQDIYDLSYYIIEFIKVTQIESDEVQECYIQEQSISAEEYEPKKGTQQMINQNNTNGKIHTNNTNYFKGGQLSTQRQRNQYMDIHYNEQEFNLFSPNQSNFESSQQQLQPYIERLTSQQQHPTIQNQQQITKDNKGSNGDHISESEINLKNNQQESKASSIYNIRNYKYAKQYDFYEEISQKKIQKPVKLCICIILLQLLLNIIYSSIIVIQQHNDIQRFLKEIDLISLHSSVMAPHDMFYATKATITTYQRLYRNNEINKSKLDELIDPLYENIDLGYNEMRDNFYDLLSNQYLQDFFTGVTNTVYFMKDNDTSIYPITLNFKEFISVELQYQYASKVTFNKRGSPAGQAYQVFNIANYFKLHDTLTTLTREIKQYSMQRAAEAENKWITIWILFSVINFILSCTSLNFLNKNLILYEKFLRMFYFVDRRLYNQEIEKLARFYEQLESYPDSIFSYQFHSYNNQFKSNTYKSSTLKSNTFKTTSSVSGLHRIFRMQDQKYGKSLKRISIIVQMFLFFGFFFLESTLISQRNTIYLNRYIQTTDFYKLIQDLRFRSNIYLYRDLKLKWANFTYATDEDLRLLYELIDDSKVVMKSYLLNYLNPKFEQYLCSDSFIQLYNEVQHSNLCNYLTDDYYQFMGRYCYIALEGTIVQGMAPCINFILNSFETEQAVNNLTEKTETKYYETEGGILTTRVFGNLSYSLKAGMIQITEQKNQFDYILSGITYCFCFSFGLVLLFILKNYYETQFYYIRKMLTLMPIDILIHDNSLERLLRQIYITQQF